MKDAAVTIGFFDGVHRGHRRILEVLAEQKSSNGCESVIITFDRLPKRIPGLLTTLDEKLRLLEYSGVDRIEVIEFDSGFSAMTPGEFFERYIIGEFNARKFIAGHDFAFGKDRSGGLARLRELCEGSGIDLCEVGPVKSSLPGGRNEIISSSLIRRLLVEGRIGEANRLLERPYSIGGTVVRGDGVAGRLGFPTVNIAPGEGKLLPGGIFYAQCVLGDSLYPGVAYIGRKPTTGGPGKDVSCEAHLLDFSGKTDGREAVLLLQKKLRDEEKFSSEQLLRDRISGDVEKVSVFLRTGSWE